MTEICVAATQMACSPNRDANIANADALVREAATKGAQIILLQELFETPYFCQDQRQRHFAEATSIDDNPAIQHFRAVAKELSVVLPISFFEKAGNAFFNSVVVLDADGSNLGLYRKSHIPDGPGYQEKFYFSPGDSGFKVFETRYARIGVGICWDQWFPECARAMALQGAELLFYPTAIGTEPHDPTIDSKDHWTRAMQGHAASNYMPVIASNRIGREDGDQAFINFYGSSFIAGPTGALVEVANKTDHAVLTARFDLAEIAKNRASWGMFRDRRPELYRPLLTLDGSQYHKGA